MEFRIEAAHGRAEITLENQVEKNGILFFDVKMVQAEEAIPEPFKIVFKFPVVDVYSVWSPNLRWDRSLGPDWGKRTTTSRLASWMPLHAVVSVRGKNRMTVALSDAVTPTSIATGVCEEDACLDCEITFFTIKVAPLKEYRATVRIDLRDIPYYDSLYDAVSWWETACGYVPASVPEYARLPMNSLWYTYHQRLDVEDIIRECELSKAIGMDTVIVDDGWQTDDNNRGYAFCGDWEVAPGKIPDMKKFVERIHGTGVKIMLWFAVPFIGIHSKNYQRFKDKLLDETGDWKTRWAIDPRYKECRDFLIDTYSKAISEWGLDGLKLDFIDAFALRGKSLAYDARRDYQSLEEAIDVLMIDVTRALRAIREDVLIEFRQSYVGPAIRKYGNMLRVSDCPDDAILNRYDAVNLRFTSGRTAVHSDMLMWNYDDPAENAALQFASALYTVPQISVKLAKLSGEHKKMLSYYLSFWRENRDVLLDGKLCALNPESGYSLVWTEKDGRAVFTSYTDPVIDCASYRETIAVNGSGGNTLILKGAKGRLCTVVNCMGEILSRCEITETLCEIRVPLSGMVFVKETAS